MEASRNTNSALLSTLFLFLLLIISSSTSLNYHNTFFPTSLSHAHHEPEEPLTVPESDPNTMTLSLPLLHVDHLHPAKSSLSATEFLRLRLRRDILRAQAHKHLGGPAQLNSSVYSGFLQGSGEFFTHLWVGTPPQLAQFVIDTGSDLTWLQCAPCEVCYKQTDPVYDPAQSKSFNPVPCDSKLCHPVHCKDRSCQYGIEYGDDSFSKGKLATETLTFRTTRLARVTLGCGHINRGLFFGAGGLLGLGRGKLSLTTQKGHLFNRTFSYCLVSRYVSKGSSWLMFGNPAVPQKAVYTPMVKGRVRNMADIFYTVRLTGISVGGQAVELPEAAAEKEVIVDSGTAVTRLSQGMYKALRDAFKEGNKNLIPADSPMPDLFDTCYSMREGDSVTAVALQFEGGAFMELPLTNSLVPLDDEGTYCFAFAGDMDGPGILGNTQQQGFRVVFDLEGHRVGFAPDSCSNPT
ncbi:Eukaryotic aspartyl protease family protein [Striga hermonthica]|uniref:Eukaryotic aspartyl protease family protein n=1 Tax=Striga hermonthica TaxID=68872 RepID=A0A9N7NE74_STRHE|nr:Eukaryotic aspartyl protease family protein [Striga hermonthica]